MLFLDGSLTPSFADTGSSVSVISFSIFRRLRKVILPPQGAVLGSAFNVINALIAAATARLVVKGECYPTEFRVHTESSHYVILGCDFLSNNEDVIDYTSNEILLSRVPMLRHSCSENFPQTIL